MRILLAPGQGSQSEGFLTQWLSEVPDFEKHLVRLSNACDKDLIELGTAASEAEIKDTANAQPLIVAASIAAARSLPQLTVVDGVVGHSVGEFAAAAIAGVISDEDAMHLVSIRANAMAEAASLIETSMAAVLGGEEKLIEVMCQELGLEVANYNGAGQLVVAGDKAKIQELVSAPPEKTRVIELKVAGAFHTRYMESAVTKLAAAAASISTQDPKIKLWSNVDGSPVTSGQTFLASLVEQVSNPVRWDRCMKTIDDLGAQLIELPPAGALSGLAKRGMPNSSAIALKTPSDVEKIGA